MANKKKRNSLGTLKGFSIHFLPFSEIKNLDSNQRMTKVLDIVLGNNILILQGRLRPIEETRLIGDTMAMINHIKHFKGIELAVISGEGTDSFFGKMKQNLVSVLSGGDLSSITIIGPATVVKEIKRNPKKIELLLNK